MKYYAVKKGKNPGIYTSWEECQNEVLGFSGAIYKSFENYDDAVDFINSNQKQNLENIAYIDGSYDAKTGNYSFGGVLLVEGKELHFKKAYPADEFSKHHNVAGEIKGAGYVLNYCYKNQIYDITLCYDYMGIEKWYNLEWQAKSDIAKLYVEFVKNIKCKMNVKFVKIKSHTGEKYNELADKLAKEALGI